MSSSIKNTTPINWQEVPNSELGWNEANPEDVAMVWEAEEAKRHKEAKEAEKRACEAEVWHWEAAEAKRRREAEQQKEAERAKEAKKWQHTESEARPSRSWGQDSKARHQAEGCMQLLLTQQGEGDEKKKRTRRVWLTDDDNDNDNDNVVVVSTHKAGKLESGVRETMAQVVDRRMGMAMMAKSNWDLTWVLYCGFQSMDTLVDEVQIFGAEGFLPKPASESKPAKDELQEALRKVKELQEEHLEWAMERLQMQKGWMQKEEEALTRHLKGKGKEPAKESEQEEEEQGTGDEGKEGEAE
ncbi:hypothetical protein ID866_11863 [Astraeus odoratus]|nr:hypothetical protein ID866_11863 [Astraeus odoratus]